jgi:type I restriction-modification system DNA methylase subunit
MLETIVNHIRNRDYMSGVERTQQRIKATGEVFTPTELVQEMLDQLPPEVFSDPTKTFLDNSCGDGQFLGEVLIRKMENGSTFEQALSTIYGVDLMPDNVTECRKRLLCGRKDLEHIVRTNIVCHDALTYDYSFNGTDKNQEDLQWEELFKIVDNTVL